MNPFHNFENQRIISALIGLAGALNTNEKTENTDNIVRQALLSQDSDEMIYLIHKEKFTISPGCVTCQNPCGNTSDFAMEEFMQAPEEILQLKWQLVEALQKIASKKGDNQSLPQLVYRGISFLGYDLEAVAYQNLLEQMKEVSIAIEENTT